MIKVVKTAQDIQDDIFRKMSADERLELWVGLWRLAKDLAGDKLTYGTNRSKSASDKQGKSIKQASGGCRICFENFRNRAGRRIFKKMGKGAWGSE